MSTLDYLFGFEITSARTRRRPYFYPLSLLVPESHSKRTEKHVGQYTSKSLLQINSEWLVRSSRQPSGISAGGAKLLHEIPKSTTSFTDLSTLATSDKISRKAKNAVEMSGLTSLS